jgi:zinc transporter 2
MKKLFFVSFICFIFMGLELAGGILSGSLAILTDAAHMFSDVAGFMISFFSIYISQNNSPFAYSYCYHRAEILGAFMSIFLIWGLLGWLNYEAT